MTIDANTAAIALAIGIILGGLWYAAHIIRDARREWAATEAAIRQNHATSTATAPGPTVRVGGNGATYRFRCVSCRGSVEIPLAQLAGGLWRPIRCDDCAPAEQQGRAS